MKSILILLMSLFTFPFMIKAQVITNIDEITPFHEELAAVRKGNTWGFINTKGEMVIDYREDLVWTSDPIQKSKKKISRKEPVKYPYFNDGRCLIKKMIQGIYYYGYIDKNGETVIEPKFLNATPFYNGSAIVLKISEEELGRNDILDKRVVSYSYDEIVIDVSGNDKIFLKGPVHLVYKKDRLRNPPAIQSYLISPNLAATKDKDDRWQLYSLNSSN